MSNIKQLLVGEESLADITRWESIDDISTTATGDISLPKLVDAYNRLIAFLQYTSGSTSEPKGVIIGHDNLGHNLELIVTGLKAREDTVVVSWLPQYHDMGLIGSYLGVLYCGGSGYYLSPMTFIKNPTLWVRCISRYRGTHMQAPNFAYTLAAKKFIASQRAPGKLPQKLDLSSVRHMINAAEPVDSATIETFYAVFSEHGLPANVVFPTYGLAEHTVYVCSNGQRKLTVDKAALEANRVELIESSLASAAESDSTDGTKKSKKTRVGEVLMGCGRPVDEKQVTVKIVDPESRLEVAANTVGEIWVDSPSKAKGYWGLPEKSAEDFQAELAGSESSSRFLRTGDLGFLHEGELFVCGRLKDMIILHGKNYYPHDLEKTGEALSASATKLEVRKGCSAAFGHRIYGQEAVLYVAEITDAALVIWQGLQEKDTSAAHRLAQSFVEELRNEIRQAHGLSVAFVGLVVPRTIPKTSSGKIARQWVKKGYLEGSLKYLYAWNSLDADDSLAGADTALGGDPATTSEILSPDGTQANRIDPTGLPLSFVLQELQTILGKVLKVDPASVQTRIPVAAMGMDSAQGILLQATLDERFSVPLPEELMFDTDTTLTTIATSMIRGGTYTHRPIMVRAIDAIQSEGKRNGFDNSNLLVIAFRMIWASIFKGSAKKKSSMKTILPNQWFKEHQVLADIDTLRFKDGSAKEVVAMPFWQEVFYFYFALQLFGVFFWVPLSLLGVFLTVPWRYALGFMVIFLCFVYLPNYQCWPPAFRTHYGMRLVAKYYSYRTIIEAPIAAYDGVPSVYALGPHGVFGIGPAFQAMINGLVAGEDFHVLAAPAVFSFPLYNVFLQMLGACSVERASFVGLLRRGHSVGVIPGGIAEMFALRPHEEAMVVASRKGFVKIALETGTQIVPTYCFGNTQTFSSGSTPWLAALSRMCRTSLIAFWGRYGLPIPHRVPLLTVLGRPIQVPKVENPSPALINEYHELYLRETRRLYDTYKNTYNWQDRRLVFVSG